MAVRDGVFDDPLPPGTFFEVRFADVERDLSNDQEHGLILPNCGAILQRRLRTKGAYGFAYERTVRYKKPIHVHTRLTIAKPRGASRVLFHFPQHKPATYEVNSGEIFIFPSQIQHEQEAKTTIWDVFALYPAPELLPTRLANLNSPLSFASTALLDSLFDRVFLMMCCENIVSTKQFPEYEQILAILGQELCGIEDSTVAPFLGSSVDRALAYIEAHLFEELTTESIAKAARRSSASLFRDFEKHIGMSPKEYARNRRFEEAAQLLRQGQLSVQDVCLMVGYDDVSSFSKAFKSLYGTSPQGYREREQTKSG